MHSYTIELRIISDNTELDFNAITKNLGIAPTNTRQIGEAKSDSGVFTESMWGYSVCTEHDDKDWDSLEDALDLLLKRFWPFKKKIAEYGKIYNVVIWCGHFTSSFDGGPTFSPKVLKNLGEFGVELYIDTYCCKEE